MGSSPARLAAALLLALCGRGVALVAPRAGASRLAPRRAVFDFRDAGDYVELEIDLRGAAPAEGAAADAVRVDVAGARWLTVSVDGAVVVEGLLADCLVAGETLWSLERDDDGAPVELECVLRKRDGATRWAGLFADAAAGDGDGGAEDDVSGSAETVHFSAAPRSSFATADPSYAFIYSSMRDDARRNAAYAAALAAPESGVRGKVVLDVGTGPLALLALLAADAGAAHVFALEVNGAALRAAEQAVAARGLEGVITLVAGLSTALAALPPLPGCTEPALVDVVLSELVGNIASAEGAAATLLDARRFVKSNAGPSWSIPSQISSYALPVRLPAEWRARFERENDRIAEAFAAADAETLEALTLIRPEAAFSSRKSVFRVDGSLVSGGGASVAAGFPLGLALSDSPQAWEWVDFGAGPVETLVKSTTSWTIDDGGVLDGFLLFNALSCAEAHDVSSLDAGSNWQPLVLALQRPRSLARGAIVELEAQADLASPQPMYTWRVRVSGDAPLDSDADAAPGRSAPVPAPRWETLIREARRAKAAER